MVISDEEDVLLVSIDIGVGTEVDAVADDWMLDPLSEVNEPKEEVPIEEPMEESEEIEPLVEVSVAMETEDSGFIMHGYMRMMIQRVMSRSFGRWVRSFRRYDLPFHI